MNKYTRFDEIPLMTLKDIKETKRYGRTDNVKTVYPPTNTVCGGYNKKELVPLFCTCDMRKVFHFKNGGKNSCTRFIQKVPGLSGYLQS